MMMMRSLILIVVFTIRCRSECPENKCEKICEHGFANDSNGCPICQCATTYLSVPVRPSSCPKFHCGLQCKYGFKKTKSGCDLCQCSLGPKCVKPSCKSNCTNGFLSDKRNCPTCKCAGSAASTECATLDCADGTICKEVATGCEVSEDEKCEPIAITACVKVCPKLKCKACKSGFVVGADGCKTCSCIDPCERTVCSDGQKCERTEKGFTCVASACKCPARAMPASCNHLATRDLCNGCYSNCELARCGENEKCCPDWYGCMSCAKCEY